MSDLSLLELAQENTFSGETESLSEQLELESLRYSRGFESIGEER